MRSGVGKFLYRRISTSSFSPIGTPGIFPSSRLFPFAHIKSTDDWNGAARRVSSESGLNYHPRLSFRRNDPLFSSISVSRFFTHGGMERKAASDMWKAIFAGRDICQKNPRVIFLFALLLRWSDGLRKRCRCRVFLSTVHGKLSSVKWTFLRRHICSNAIRYFHLHNICAWGRRPGRRNNWGAIARSRDADVVIFPLFRTFE